MTVPPTEYFDLKKAERLASRKADKDAAAASGPGSGSGTGASTPPAARVIVHEWIWSRRELTARVSWLLLKRLNLIQSAPPPRRS